MKRVCVIILCSLPSLSLMSLLNIPHPWEEASGKTPESPLAGVGCLAGWLTHLQTQVLIRTPHTSEVTWTLHTPIYLSDSHHDFQCQDDAAVISSTDPEGSPRSGESKQTAACRVPSMFGPSSLWKQGACHVSGRPGPRKLGQLRTENLLQQRFLVHCRKGRERSRHKLCIL